MEEPIRFDQLVWQSNLPAPEPNIAQWLQWFGQQPQAMRTEAIQQMLIAGLSLAVIAIILALLFN